MSKKRNTFSSVLILITTLFIAGCATMSASYTPPLGSHVNTANYTRVINKPFDDVWKALIQHSASTFFSIDNFEKDSGLITLSFGSSTPSEYVDGGQWTASNFTGKYVDYLETIGQTSLDGKMNIIVMPINEKQTQVTVRARYIYSLKVRDASGRHGYDNMWSFDTGGSDSVKVGHPAMGTTSATRTMKPTYKAEGEILKGISALSK